MRDAGRLFSIAAVISIVAFHRWKGNAMKRKLSRSEEIRVKAQQSGRRLSGNQQRELTGIQTKHPQVEAAEEAMKKKDRIVPNKP